MGRRPLTKPQDRAECDAEVSPWVQITDVQDERSGDPGWKRQGLVARDAEFRRGAERHDGETIKWNAVCCVDLGCRKRRVRHNGRGSQCTPTIERTPQEVPTVRIPFWSTCIANVVDGQDDGHAAPQRCSVRRGVEYIQPCAARHARQPYLRPPEVRRWV